MKINYDDSDLKKLKKKIKKLGSVPKECAQEAAQQGASIVLSAVRSAAPELTGQLKSGLILVTEKSKTEGKRVVQVTFDRGKNDVFQKPIKNPGLYGGKSKSAYYPASVDFGRLGRKGKTPGVHFMRKGVAAAEAAAQKAMIDVLDGAVEQEMSKI